MNNWISVKEKLPDDSDIWESCVVYVDNSCSYSYYVPFVTFAKYDSKQKIWHIELSDMCLNALLKQEDISYDGFYVTHWMPMPEPPKGE